MAHVRIKYVTHLEWFMACRVNNMTHQQGRMAHQREKEVCHIKQLVYGILRVLYRNASFVNTKLSEKRGKLLYFLIDDLFLGFFKRPKCGKRGRLTSLFIWRWLSRSDIIIVYQER